MTKIENSYLIFFKKSRDLIVTWWILYIHQTIGLK